jgi:hypothetical protein
MSKIPFTVYADIESTLEKKQMMKAKYIYIKLIHALIILFVILIVKEIN